ncbi:DUF7260 family protein [Halomarina oriensis]|uniref:DUF7260 domain-containing protein n=1 Tax=Halomarina oriensis TaxID=671145 RepID=A0A6B0GFM6_9EURY|nr:hypothetical protein [Halomarina oriensis]MWG33504.1 hypothetical protein [Halomarina oriensis]
MSQTGTSSDGRQRDDSTVGAELQSIETAKRYLRTERTELGTEREAFRTFADRLSRQRFTARGGDGGLGAVRSLRRPADGGSVTGEIRRAFRETVMAVDHYDDIYGESLDEHLRSELGPDIAAVVTSSAAPSPTLRGALLAAVEEAIADRRALSDLVEGEWDSLVDARRRLEPLATAARSETTPSEWTAELDAVAVDRQRLIRQRIGSPYLDGHDLCAYLYDDVDDWTYPVLTICASLRARASVGDAPSTGAAVR